MSRYIVRYFDPRTGSVITGHRFRIFALLRFYRLKHLGHSVSMTDSRNAWRVFS